MKTLNAIAASLALALSAAMCAGTSAAQTSCPPSQSTPNFQPGGNVFGRTAPQWNAYFGAKVDATNGCLTNPSLIDPTVNGGPLQLSVTAFSPPTLANFSAGYIGSTVPSHTSATQGFNYVQLQNNDSGIQATWVQQLFWGTGQTLTVSACGTVPTLTTTAATAFGVVAGISATNPTSYLAVNFASSTAHPSALQMLGNGVSASYAPVQSGSTTCVRLRLPPSGGTFYGDYGYDGISWYSGVNSQTIPSGLTSPGIPVYVGVLFLGNDASAGSPAGAIQATWSSFVATSQ